MVRIKHLHSDMDLHFFNTGYIQVNNGEKPADLELHFFNTGYIQVNNGEDQAFTFLYGSTMFSYIQDLSMAPIIK